MKAFAGNSPHEEDISFILQNLGDRSFRGKTLLVTGGAGFLGSWICEILINKGASVICLDNLSSGLRSNIEHLVGKDNFEFVERDVTEPLHFEEKIDVVLHLASRASPFEFEHYPIEILKANTLGTLNILEISRQKGARFLFASTSEVYGDPSVVPTPESYHGNVNTIGVRGCYDEGKRCGEAYVIAYGKQYNLDIRIARIFNTYGPKMRGDGVYGRVVPRFVSQALTGQPITAFGTGEQTRSFCYITDQVEGLLRFICTDEARAEVINIGNNREVSIIELANTIKSLTGSNSQIVFCPLPQDDPGRRCPDTTKANNIIGWRPRMTLEQGLTKVINYFKESPETALRKGSDA